jgi:hypothetical protein
MRIKDHLIPGLTRDLIYLQEIPAFAGMRVKGSRNEGKGKQE